MSNVSVTKAGITTYDRPYQMEGGIILRPVIRVILKIKIKVKNDMRKIFHFHLCLSNFYISINIENG